MLKALVGAFLRFVARRPSSVAGVSIFAIGFSIVAGNALYSQPGKHPVPLWATRDAVTTRSLPPAKTEMQRAPQLEVPAVAETLPLDRVPIPVARPRTDEKVSGPDKTLVTKLQERLKDRGFYEAEIDGLVGPMTRAAIAEYQAAHGLTPSGEASPDLLDHISGSIAAPSRMALAEPKPAAPPAPKEVIAPNSAPVIESIQAVIRESDTTPRAQTANLREEPVTAAEPAVQEQSEAPKDDTRLARKPAFEPGVHEIRDSALVARVQIGLINFGETGISVDGVMTDRTRQAIRFFQQRYGLAVTGVPDLAVIRKMEQIGALQRS